MIDRGRGGGACLRVEAHGFRSLFGPCHQDPDRRAQEDQEDEEPRQPDAGVLERDDGLPSKRVRRRRVGEIERIGRCCTTKRGGLATLNRDARLVGGKVLHRVLVAVPSVRLRVCTLRHDSRRNPTPVLQLSLHTAPHEEPVPSAKSSCELGPRARYRSQIPCLDCVKELDARLCWCVWIVESESPSSPPSLGVFWEKKYGGVLPAGAAETSCTISDGSRFCCIGPPLVHTRRFEACRDCSGGGKDTSSPRLPV